MVVLAVATLLSIAVLSAAASPNITEFGVDACYYFNGYGNITHFTMNCTATCGLLKFQVGNKLAEKRWNYSKTDVCEPTGTLLSLVPCDNPGDCTGGITRRVEVDMESQFGTAVHVICKASEPKKGGTNPTSSKLLISAYPTSCFLTPTPTSSYPSPTTVKSSADSTVTPQDSFSITTFTNEFKPTMNTPTFTTDLPKDTMTTSHVPDTIIYPISAMPSLTTSNMPHTPVTSIPSVPTIGPLIGGTVAGGIVLTVAVVMVAVTLFLVINRVRKV